MYVKIAMWFFTFWAAFDFKFFVVRHSAMENLDKFPTYSCIIRLVYFYSKTFLKLLLYVCYEFDKICLARLIRFVACLHLIDSVTVCLCVAVFSEPAIPNPKM